MKIFAAHDGGSGCCFYRISVPLTELAAHDGFEVTFADAGDRDGHKSPVTARQLEGHNVIVGQRLSKHAGLHVWRGARGPLSRLVYEIDDDVFTVNAENWQAFNLFRRGDIRDAITHAAQVADLITVTTAHLAQVMTEATGNGNVAVLPNYVPGWVLEMPGPGRPRPAVGWQGGASHGADVGLVVNPVRRFLQRFPGWDLRLAGTDYRPTFRLTADRAFYSSWIPVFEDAPGYYATMDYQIALAPLLPNAFNKSKSAVKAVEHLARGIPVLASDCDVYRGTVIDGVNGFLIRHEHEWLARLSELAADDGLREKMGAAARESARAWTIEANWRQWADAYTRLFPRRS